MQSDGLKNKNEETMQRVNLVKSLQERDIEMRRKKLEKIQNQRLKKIKD